MSSRIPSRILDPGGRSAGLLDLESRVRIWLEDPRVMRMLLDSGEELGDLVAIHRYMHTLSARGMARVLQWLFKHRLVRRAILRHELSSYSNRKRAKGDLRQVVEWARLQLGGQPS